MLFRSARTCGEDCVLNGFAFRKGALVLLPVYSIQHNPDVWPEPEVFNPER